MIYNDGYFKWVYYYQYGEYCSSTLRRNKNKNKKKLKTPTLLDFLKLKNGAEQLSQLGL